MFGTVFEISEKLQYICIELVFTSHTGINSFFHFLSRVISGLKLLYKKGISKEKDYSLKQTD